MQIKTTVRYHLTLRIAIIKKSTNNLNTGKMWRKGNPPTVLVGRQIGGITMKNSIEVI